LAENFKPPGNRGLSLFYLAFLEVIWQVRTISGSLYYFFEIFDKIQDTIAQEEVTQQGLILIRSAIDSGRAHHANYLDAMQAWLKQ